MAGPARVSARFDRDGVVATRVEGRADLETDAPVTPATRFRWFSVTKIVTATVVMQLVDAGALRLDEPVPLAGGARLDALLAHTSGLPDPPSLGWVHPPGEARRTPRELTRALLRRHPPGRPGPVRYSNLGYLVLGERVAEAAGRPFAEQVRETLLAPAGMTGTGFAPAPAAVGHEALVPRGLAMAALFFPRSARLARYVRGRWIGLAPFELEGEAYGGLLGPLADLVRLGRLHLRDGELDGVRLLSRASARAMRAPFNAGFGLGFERYPDGWVGHEGAAGGFRAALRLHPGRGVGVATLAAWGDAAV